MVISKKISAAKVGTEPTLFDLIAKYFPPPYNSMGILLFGLSGVIILTLTGRMIASHKGKPQ